MRGAQGRRLLGGVAASAGTHAVGLASALALVPLFIRAWGADGYGTWLASVAAVSWLALLEFGAQLTAANTLAAQYAREDLSAFRRTLAQYTGTFAAVASGALVIVLLLLTAAVFVPLGGAPALGGPVAVVLGLLAINTLASIPAGIYATVYRATGLFSRGAAVGNAGKLAGAIVTGLLLWAAAPPWAVAVGMIGASAALTALVVHDTRRRFPSLKDLVFDRAHVRAPAAAWSVGARFWAMAVSQTVSQQGVISVIAALSGPAAAAAFVAHRTLASTAGYLGSMVQAPAIPELAALCAREDRERLRETCTVLVRGVAAATTLAAGVLWIAGPAVFAAWTGGAVPFDARLLGVLLVQSVLAAGWSTSVWSLIAANRPDGLAVWSVANAIVTVLLAVGVMPPTPLGVALASLAADVLCGFLVFPLAAARFLDMSVRPLYGAMLGGAGAPAMLMVALAAARLAGIDSWALVGIAAAAGSLWFVRELAASSGALFSSTELP